MDCVMEGNKPTVLILCPTRRDEYHAAKINDIPDDTKQRFRFYKATSGENESFDLLRYIELCEKIIVKENVQQIMSFSDIGVLVHSALVQKFPSIKGPSVESVLVPFHKYYSRLYLDSKEATLKHVYIDPTEFDVDKLRCALDYVGVPGVIKPCTGTDSFGVSRISSVADLQEYITWYNSQRLGKQSDEVKFTEKYADTGMYPYFANNGLILEEFVDDAKTASMEGYVFQGEIFHWQITENVYWKRHPLTFKGCAMPFRTFDENLTARLWETYDAIIGKAIERGFDNQFIHVEAFVRLNGDVKVMEINPRMFTQFIQVYRMCCENGDPMAALLDIGSGVRPGPCIWNDKFGFNGYVVTFATGKAEELLDFDEVANFPEVSLRCCHGDEIRDCGDGGANLAYVNIAGKNRQDVMMRYYYICEKILKKPEFSPSVEDEEDCNDYVY